MIQEELWASVIDSFKRIYRSSEKNLWSKTGLSIPEFRMLALLSDSDSSMSTISNHLGLTQAAITGLVDKLTAMELVERIRSEEDRRIIMIRITEKGIKSLKRAQKVHKDLVEQSLGSLSPLELQNLSETLDKLANTTAKLIS